MSVWQKRARLVVAVVGIACAAIVYFAIGRRAPAAAPEPVTRIDPAASAESHGCEVFRFRGERRDFEVTCETQLAYPDGSVRMIKVEIKVNKPDGRSYVVTAGEAFSAAEQKQLQLSSGVKLMASDGFQMTADRADYNQEQGSFHSDVPVAFSKARMRGSGSAIDYNEITEVLTIGQSAQVVTTDEQGATTLEFRAGAATLDRLRDVLSMDGGVHVLRDQQVMDAERSVARLAPNEEFVTYIELRGNARVDGGGGTLDAMSARDIDLDYTDDGKGLERVVLNGNGGITLAGTDGAPGQQLTGEAIDIQLAADGTVSSATGRENVRMVIPGSTDAPARSVRSRALDATGVPGEGLTAARFTDSVEYREEANGPESGRIIRSRRLDLGLRNAAVTAATFNGDVSFDEGPFRAQAADARYDPKAGSLHLSGSDARGLPCVADDQIAVDAQTIDVTVDSRRLTAAGRVKTTIQPSGASKPVGGSPCALARQRDTRAQRAKAGADGETRLPGLLKQDQAAIVTSNALEYGGTGKALIYTGEASLFQGETTLRGDVIRIDQEHGDLTVTGGATSRIVQGTGEEREIVRGTAEEIQYIDGRRMISYRSVPGGRANARAGKPVQVNGPQGHLSANSIDVVLNRDDGRAERLEAYRNVTAKIDTKTATADRLTYHADKDQYEMVGAGSVPARIVDSCGETSGKAVTYWRADNRIQVRSDNEWRTQTRSAACQSGSPASR